jgi:hypothetical protein
MSFEGKNMKGEKGKRGKFRGRYCDPETIFIPNPPPPKKKIDIFSPSPDTLFYDSYCAFLP